MDLEALALSVGSSIVCSSAIATLVVTALKDRWIERARAGYAKELEGVKDLLLREQKALQARVDRSVFVSKAQFDAEFNAMRDIFRYATQVSLAIDPIRPMLEFRSGSETKEEGLRALLVRADNAVPAFNLFSSELSILRPFYPESLFEELSEFRRFASIEIGQTQLIDENTFSPRWYRDGEQNRTNLSAHYLEAGRIIRSRLDQLSVVPS